MKSASDKSLGDKPGNEATRHSPASGNERASGDKTTCLITGGREVEGRRCLLLASSVLM